MGIITKMRKHKAVYWAKTGVDTYGDPILDTPVLIDCRWQDTVEEYMSDLDEKKLSKSKVFPDRVLTVGGYLWRAADDATDTTGAPGDPLASKVCYRIEQMAQIPNLRNTQILYKVML